MLRRLCTTVLVSLLGIGLVGSAHAKTFSLASGSGAQLHIGGGLALPIQPAATVLVTGQFFPPLLIPVATPFKTIMGTTNATGMAPKITVPAGALKKVASQVTVGVFADNPTLYAVATNLSYTWPFADAVFATTKAVIPGTSAAASVIFPGGGPGGNTIRYSNRVVGRRFGGAGVFNLVPGPAHGLIAGPVTIYALAVPTAGAGNPPCHHPAFNSAFAPGVPPPPGNPACVAAIIEAKPTGNAAGGGITGNVVATAPLNQFPGIFVGAFGTGPLKPVGPPGSVSIVAPTPNSNPGPTNMAISTGYPFTTARITMSAATAMGGAEKFIISGDDTRTGQGNGTLQMVSGSMSDRPLSGTNANRQWVRLVIVGQEAAGVSTVVQAITVSLIVLMTMVYVVRTRRTALF